MGLFRRLAGLEDKSVKEDTTLNGKLTKAGMPLDKLAKKAKVSESTLSKYLDTEFDDIPARTKNKISKFVG